MSKKGPRPLFRVAETLPPDATIIATTNPEEWIRRDFTVQEVADLLTMPYQTVTRYVREGKFPNSRRVGEAGAQVFIPGQDVDALLKTQRRQPPGRKAAEQS